MQLDFDLKSGAKKTPASAPASEPVVLSVGVLSVGVLTRKIRELLESGVGEVWVEGEVSNLRKQSSGHVYFTLKDASSQLACVMFASQAAQLRGMRFADGAQVQIFGQITVYEARGNYQIIVRRVRERGVGALQAKFEELKRRLAEEGLFSPERKRPLPRFPRRIGVVTSPTGAAIRDFLNVLHRRQRGIEVVIFPVRVQGQGAAAEIAEAVRMLGTSADSGIEAVDVIVVTRGGGSLEDLWEFNEEAVARAIAGSPVPVVSAVGHEIDFTISDFAADLRAPTPSAAAEILSADGAELLEHLAQLSSRLQRSVAGRVDAARERIQGFHRTVLFSEPRRVLLQGRQDVDRLSDDLLRGISGGIQSRRLVIERSSGILSSHSPARRISEALAFLIQARTAMGQRCGSLLDAARSELEKNAAVLGALNPSAALARGYTMTLDAEGKFVRSAKTLSDGQSITTQFPDGRVGSVVVVPPQPDDRDGRGM
ncbi:MAG: exodeoxyribonuclease VII large subunit [Verrucomicrobiaceae bacterium]|nr:MAG: exodeoxyribonuclease VII large subunit [Verrucomicrobiaceae bacterium]